MIGEVTGYTIGKNKDGDSDVLNLQVKITDDEDVQTVQMFSQAGEDTNPATGSEVIVIPITKSWKIGVASDDGITPSMNPGEKKIYSVSSGAIQAFINLLTSGVIEINGNDKGVARLDDTTIVDGSTDSAMIGWISAVSTFINGLAPGTITVIPTTINGKINSASSTVKTGA